VNSQEIEKSDENSKDSLAIAMCDANIQSSSDKITFFS